MQVDADAGDDLEEVAGLARRLRAELLVLDVERVDPVAADEAPAAAKGLPAAAGAIAVRVGTAGLAAVVAKIRDWASRNRCKVKLQIGKHVIVVDGPTPEQQEKLINAWLARVSST